MLVMGIMCFIKWNRCNVLINSCALYSLLNWFSLIFWIRLKKVLWQKNKKYTIFKQNFSSFFIMSCCSKRFNSFQQRPNFLANSSLTLKNNRHLSKNDQIFLLTVSSVQISFSFWKKRPNFGTKRSPFIQNRHLILKKTKFSVRLLAIKRAEFPTSRRKHTNFADFPSGNQLKGEPL